MAKPNKTYTYIVKVIKTDFVNEEEIYETEYEAEPNEYESCACANALSIAYHGVADN